MYISMDALLLNVVRTVGYVKFQRKKNHKDIIETRCIREAKEPKIAFIVFNKSSK